MAALRASRLVWSARSSMTLEDAADLLALLAERQRPGGDRVDPVGDGVHRGHRGRDGGAAVLGVAQRLGRVAGDRLGGVGDLRGGRRELLDRRGGLGDGGRLLGGAGGVLLGGREQLAGAGGDLVAAGADLLDQLTQVEQRVVEGLGQRADRVVGALPRASTRTARSPSAACASTDDSSSTRALSSSRSSPAVRRSSQTAAHSMPTNQVTPGPSGRTRTRKPASSRPIGPAARTAISGGDGGEDADQQAAQPGHRDRGDEQRGGHQRPVGPLRAAGRGDQAGDPDDVGDDEDGAVALDQRAVADHPLAEQVSAARPPALTTPDSQPGADRGQRVVRARRLVQQPPRARR